MTRKAMTTEIANTIQFVLEIDKLKGVLRKVRPIWEERYENTAEHSWQIALFAMSMARTLELKVEVTRVVAMLLVHDLGEIDAGDKSIFVQDGWEERRAAELKALERICGLAPKETGDFLLGLWKEFDAGESAGARFAKAIDRSMPILLILKNNGGSWLENGVSYERVVERVRPEIESGCPELWEHLKPQLEEGRRKGFFATSAS
jgi:putative hydrolase of HD superfamily